MLVILSSSGVYIDHYYDIDRLCEKKKSNISVLYLLLYIKNRTCKVLDVMISDNLLDYQYELKPLSDDFHTTKDSDIFVNDTNVRIYMHDTFHSLYCVLFWSKMHSFFY